MKLVSKTPFRNPWRLFSSVYFLTIKYSSIMTDMNLVSSCLAFAMHSACSTVWSQCRYCSVDSLCLMPSLATSSTSHCRHLQKFRSSCEFWFGSSGCSDCHLWCLGQKNPQNFSQHSCSDCGKPTGVLSASPCLYNQEYHI